MDIQKDINWELFNEKEKEQILNCYHNDSWHKLCCLPDVNIDTPEKEKEIEKIVIDMRGIDEIDESKVREELDKFWAQGDGIDTPEKEAEWQAKIDKENEEKKKALEEETNK